MGLERQRQVGRAYRWKCIVRACMFLYTHICATGLPFLSQSSWCTYDMQCLEYCFSTVLSLHAHEKVETLVDLSTFALISMMVLKWHTGEWVRAVCCALLVTLQTCFKWQPTISRMHMGAWPHKVCLLELGFEATPNWSYLSLYITYVFVGVHKCCNPTLSHLCTVWPSSLVLS